MKRLTPILDLQRLLKGTTQKMLKPVKFSPYKDKSRTLSRTFCLALITLFFSFATAVAQEDGASGGADGGGATDPAVIAAGEALFKQNCTVCHSINERVVGPALKDLHKRRPLPWIIEFVRNSQKVIQSGDPYAVQLYNEYNKTLMTPFDFSDEEITSIVAYIQSASEAPAPQAAQPTTGTDTQAGAQDGAGVPSQYINIILIGLLVVLALILLVLVLIVSVLTRYLKQKTDIDPEDREIIEQKAEAGKVLKSNGFLGFMVFVFTAIVLKAVIDGLFTVGVQQGYQPTQPIAFSHQLHAGQYEIDCNYCHTGVRKSKNANIPSPNICMNCHTVIQNVGGQTGMSPEIQKIYAAVESNTPIEWVRIHNLPDLAYFNHAQHVEVGGLDCQTCHGPVQEMEVVYQYSPLTMGWCINCHRETQVNAEGNAYYDKLIELHKKNTKDPMTVEDIGGLECSKCHY